jgi:hypothetical protein
MIWMMMSYAGLTRVPIDLRKKNFQKKMACPKRRQSLRRPRKADCYPGNNGGI